MGERELCVAARDGTAVPAYLAPRDEVWLREVMGELDGAVGRAVEEAEPELSNRILGFANMYRVSRKTLAGVRRVLGRWWKTCVDTPLPPARLRTVVFELAAAPERPPRDEVFAAAGSILGLDAAVVEACLFADRPQARRFMAPEPPPSPGLVVQTYNLVLLQSLLLRADEVRIHVRSHVRSVVRFAKLWRLLCTFVPAAEGTTVHLSGPMSLFRHTTRYGYAMASFFPAVVSTPGWSLEARCLLGETVVRVVAQASDPLLRPHALPRETDSQVERRLVRDVRRLGLGWTIERETEAIPIPGGVCFPDFTLRRGEDRVLVEVVGFYTPEYLASKLRALHAAREHRIIVLADETLACRDEEVRAAALLRYRRSPDARALLEAAERVVRGAPPASSLGEVGSP